MYILSPVATNEDLKHDDASEPNYLHKKGWHTIRNCSVGSACKEIVRDSPPVRDSHPPYEISSPEMEIWGGTPTFCDWVRALIFCFRDIRWIPWQDLEQSAVDVSYKLPLSWQINGIKQNINTVVILSFVSGRSSAFDGWLSNAAIKPDLMLDCCLTFCSSVQDPEWLNTAHVATELWCVNGTKKTITIIRSIHKKPKKLNRAHMPRPKEVEWRVLLFCLCLYVPFYPRHFCCKRHAPFEIAFADSYNPKSCSSKVMKILHELMTRNLEWLLQQLYQRLIPGGGGV